VSQGVPITALDFGARVDSDDDWRTRHAHIAAKLAAARARLRHHGEPRDAGLRGSRSAAQGAGRANSDGYHADWYHDADLDTTGPYTAEAGFDQGSAHNHDDGLGLGL
jgi:hypothetical protein